MQKHEECHNYGKIIDMIEDIWGTQFATHFCIGCAFKYRMRMGTKPNNPIDQDLKKESWYLSKAEELKKR